LDDEAKLLERARAFDETALATIFDTHYNAIYRYIYLHTGHAETAEDLSAQVFRRLLEKLRDGTGPDHYLKAWLFRVASNLIVDEVRRASHRDHLPLDDNLLADEASVDEVTENAILLAQLFAAFDLLTTTQRSAVIMRYLMEMSNDEIAAILQMTVGAVKAQQHRALVALRRWLNEEGSREQSS
jgi:RNA polymerase sigma-70 factor (ECF subfamily)